MDWSSSPAVRALRQAQAAAYARRTGYGIQPGFHSELRAPTPGPAPVMPTVLDSWCRVRAVRCPATLQV